MYESLQVGPQAPSPTCIEVMFVIRPSVQKTFTGVKS